MNDWPIVGDPNDENFFGLRVIKGACVSTASSMCNDFIFQTMEHNWFCSSLLWVAPRGAWK